MYDYSDSWHEGSGTRQPATDRILADGGAILPAQYYDAVRRSITMDGEFRLMFAVLADGINSCLKAMTRSRTANNAQFRQDVAWLEDRDASGPFAFETLCEVFGMDPGALRKALRSMRPALPNTAAPSGLSALRPPRQRAAGAHLLRAQRDAQSADGGL